jgi:hypothetical protein
MTDFGYGNKTNAVIGRNTNEPMFYYPYYKLPALEGGRITSIIIGQLLSRNKACRKLTIYEYMKWTILWEHDIPSPLSEYL